MEDSDFISFDRVIEFGINPSSKLDTNGYASGIRPNHWIRENTYTVMGQINFLDCDWLEPGNSCRAVCSFIMPKKDKVLFKTGFKWDIGEASKIVGYGKVLSE